MFKVKGCNDMDDEDRTANRPPASRGFLITMLTIIRGITKQPRQITGDGKPGGPANDQISEHETFF
jgi:hypothetical protein